MLKKMFVKNRTMTFDNNSIIVYKKHHVVKKIPLNIVHGLFYNIDDDGYYFILETDKYLRERYRVKENIEEFILNISEKGILVEPAIGQLGKENNFINYCMNNNGKILFITKNDNEILNIHFDKFERYNYLSTSVENLELDSLFKRQSNNLSKDKADLSMNGVAVINNYLTFGKGYGIVACSILKREGIIFIDDYFIYSEDQDEIKEKIIELFKK